MDENRKKIIIKEILYWKNSRLLPDQYCDYLLALYSGGEDIKQENRYENKGYRFFWCSLAAVGLFAADLVLNYFTQIPYALQTSAAILLIFGLAGLYLLVQTKIYLQICLMIGALAAVLWTVQTAEHFHAGNGLLGFLLVLHCVFWIFSGKKWGFPYFFIAGILGMAVLAGFIFKLYII